MSTQTARGVAAGQTDEERIERYLSLNPDFFERHQPLLARMRLPHMRTGSTVSLVERQVEVLREQKTDADRRLAEFIAVARANDTLAERIHRFTRRMLRAPTRSRPSRRSRPACVKTSTRFTPCCAHRAHRVAEPRGAEPFLRKLPPDDANIRTSKRCSPPASRVAARCATRSAISCSARSREHRLGGAGAAGRERLDRPARARQRRARALPPGHEHGVPEAHGRADHGSLR
jgi:hypothetical protein